MKRLFDHLKWSIVGFGLIVIILGAITVIPAIGQGGIGNDIWADGGTAGSAQTDSTSNLTNPIDGNGSELKTEGGQELGVPTTVEETINNLDFPEGVSDGGTEPGVDLASNAIVIGGADFSSDGITPDGFFFSFWNGYLRADVDSTCMMAPVSPPDGSSVYQFWATVYDNTAVGDIWLSLIRVDNYTGTVEEMANVSSADSASLQQLSDLSIVVPDILYPDYSYYVGTCIDTSVQLISARVWWNP